MPVPNIPDLKESGTGLASDTAEETGHLAVGLFICSIGIPIR